MLKNKSAKIVIVIIGLAVLTAGILLTIHFLTKKTDSYRSILIYQLEGKAEIEREGKGTIAAASNLYLESGDKVKLDPNSSMRLKLDDDKYIMVEENSILSIRAEGSDKNSKTSITLEQGAVTNEIQNKLNGDSAYEVNSPNSIMAVRGTIFRAEGYIDDTGKQRTKISTFNGTVAFQPVAPDGTKKEEILVEEGKESVIQSTQDGIQYLKNPSAIDFSELPSQTLHFLQDRMKDGSPITGITLDDLQKLIQETDHKDTTGTEPKTENTEPAGQDNTPEPGPSEQGSLDSSSPDQKPADQPSTDQQPAGQSSADDSGSSGQKTPAQTPSVKTTDSDKTKKYTVTFTYKGKTFGVQTVQGGRTASKPKLNPSPEGKWDFDFSKKIKKNITIKWITE